jgi:superfamily II DNA or RNA helicase
MPILLPYQQQAVNNVISSFSTNKSVMLQMPTGTGKTHVFCEIIKKVNKRTLVLVHTRELVEQIQQRLLAFGIKAGTIMAGTIQQPHLMVQIASIQTLTKRDIAYWPTKVSLIVIDEAHHATAHSYQSILQNYSQTDVKILGVTATPYRMNNSGFKGTFETLIESLPMNHFIEQGYLAGFRHLATASPELSRIKIDKITNDYDLTELGYLMSQETIMSDLIESYIKHGNNQQCIVFAVNRYHSKAIVERYKEVGISAAYIDSKTPKEERKKIIADFKAGKIRVLSNVQIFTEGFDCPDISVVQLARPTHSLVLYMQMVGRGLRKKQDSSQALILDNAGLWKKHGLVTKQRKWKLEGLENSAKTISVKNGTGEVEEKEPANVIEVEGLEMQEVAACCSIKTIVIPETPSIEITAHFIKENKEFASYSIKEQQRITLAPFSNILNKSKKTKKPEEIIISAKSLEIPKTWGEKIVWVQEIENVISQENFLGFMVIGWEETDNNLLLRFLRNNVDLNYINNDCWNSYKSNQKYS